MPYTRANLLSPARSLCAAFSSSTSSSIPTLLSHFTRDPYPIAHEHGLPSLAPFLGRTFSGIDGVGRYFEVLGDELGFEDMEFDPEEQWVVDTETMAVVVRGRARFWSKKSGEGWDETFVYRLGMAEDVYEYEDGAGASAGGSGGKRGLKVQEYLVWADTGAAYLARMKRLEEEVVEKVQGKEKGTTRRSLDRKRSGCGEVVGSGMNAYGSCGQ